MFFWWSTAAFAGEPEKIYGRLDSDQHYLLRAIPAAECQRLITDTLYSKAAIGQGIKALTALEKSSPGARDCLKATLGEWEKAIPAPAYVAPPPNPLDAEVSLSHAIESDSVTILKQVLCIDQPASPSCKDDLAKSEYATLMAQAQARKKEAESVSAIARTLASYLYPSPEIPDHDIFLKKSLGSSCEKIPGPPTPSKLPTERRT